MTTPISGIIKFSDLRNVFNKDGLNLNIKLSDYYNDSSTNYTSGISGIPKKGNQIKLSHFIIKLKLLIFL